MTDQPDLRAAVAAGVVGSEDSFRALLSAIVEVARSIFGAKASSILLLDEETEELVFEAVVGEGEDTLLGTRFPAGTGIAGWVLATRTPLVIEDVQDDPRFARDVAEDTGYVPKGLMAAPLLHEEGALGVLSVLDRPEQTLFSLQEMELLGLFANQAAIAVDLLAEGARGRATARRRRRRPRRRRSPRDRRRRARGRAARGRAEAPRPPGTHARRLNVERPGSSRASRTSTLCDCATPPSGPSVVGPSVARRPSASGP